MFLYGKRGERKRGSVPIRELYVATDESNYPQKIPPNAVPDSNSNCNSAFNLFTVYYINRTLYDIYVYVCMCICVYSIYVPLVRWLFIKLVIPHQQNCAPFVNRK